MATDLVTQIKDDIEKLRAELTNHDDRIADLQARVDDLREDVAERDDVIAVLKAENAERQAKVDELTAQLEAAYAKNRSLRQHIAKMQEGRHGWHVKGVELQEENANLLSVNAEIGEMIADLKAEIEERKNAMTVLGKKYRDKSLSRDHWMTVASKHAGTINRLKRILAAERELAREWPRYDDDAPVRVGDEIMSHGHPIGRVTAVTFEDGVGFVHAKRENAAISSKVYFDADNPPERAPLKAGDGKPIEPGQVLYGGDGRAWLVDHLNRLERTYPVVGTCDGEWRDLKPEWLTHEEAES